VRAREGGVVILDAPSLTEPKTKPVAELIAKVGLSGKKVLWVFDRTGDTMLKSARNIAKVKTTESSDLHPYALMNCECLVLTEGGLKSLTERLDAGRVA
jgi:ribosomal protein L4